MLPSRRFRCSVALLLCCLPLRLPSSRCRRAVAVAVAVAHLLAVVVAVAIAPLRRFCHRCRCSIADAVFYFGAVVEYRINLVQIFILQSC